MKTHYATVLDNINFEQFYYDMISAPLIALAAWGKIFISKTSRCQKLRTRLQYHHKLKIQQIVTIRQCPNAYILIYV